MLNKKTAAFTTLILLIIAGSIITRNNHPSVHPPSDLQVESDVIVHNPALEIDIEQYRAQHPSSALIYTDERWLGDQMLGMLLYEGPAGSMALLHGQLNQIGDRMYYCMMPDDWMEQMGITLEPQEDLRYTYEFERETGDSGDLMGFSNPTSLCGFDGMEEARVYGSLRALFGEPDYEDENIETMYQYRLLVTRDDGEQATLLVYSGPTGASVSSGMENQEFKEGAAFALKGLLNETPPADYDYQGYYWDGPTKVECGVQDGTPYYREQALSWEEVEALNR